MKTKFRLTSEDTELLAYVAKELVMREVSFQFVCKDGKTFIESKDEPDLDWYADEYCCNCDASATYELGEK